jgi:hypothetical protein
VRRLAKSGSSGPVGWLVRASGGACAITANVVGVLVSLAALWAIQATGEPSTPARNAVDPRRHLSGASRTVAPRDPRHHFDITADGKVLVIIPLHS